jgi:hypothetical protein
MYRPIPKDEDSDFDGVRYFGNRKTPPAKVKQPEISGDLKNNTVLTGRTK